MKMSMLYSNLTFNSNSHTLSHVSDLLTVFFVSKTHHESTSPSLSSCGECMGQKDWPTEQWMQIPHLNTGLYTFLHLREQC